MTDPKKKGPNVVRAKLAPEQPLTVRFTLRDRWGSPIPGMKMTMQQAGVELKAPGGAGIVTDASGRADVDRVTPAKPVEIKLDDQFLPADAEDRRKTQYVYAIEEKLDVVVELQVDDDPSGKLAIVDTQRAYATLVAGVGLFRPVFRFPWQNPVLSADLDDRVFRRRVVNLRFILTSLFSIKKADADALDHAGLVKKLIELFERSQAVLAQAAAAALAAPPQESTDMGTQADPPPPSQPAPPAPAPAPGTSPPVQSAERQVPMQDVTPKVAPPKAPPPNPPASVPSAAVDSAELPRWVWYLLFHHSGLRYSPPSGKPPPNEKTQFGAHGCYVKPALFLSALRTLEIESSFGDKAPKPSASDVTEALVLIERGKAPAAQKAALLSDEPAKMKSALTSIFASIRDAETKRLDTFRTSDDFYDGDYVALGMLKAKRLKSKAVLTDDLWKQVTSRTQLRNDVPAHGWEDIEQLPAELVKLLGKKVDVTQWRQRRQQTLDTIITSGVCDQTSETGELIRSGHVGAGIPANAVGATKLQYLTFSNAKNIRRGMHFFYTGFGLIKPGEQDYVFVSDNLDANAIFAADPDPADAKKKVQELTPASSVAVIQDLDALLDGDDPSNKAAAAENAKRIAAQQTAADAARAAGKPIPPDPALVPAVVIASAKSFTGARFIKPSLVGNGAKRNVIVRCVTDPKDNKIRLHACKWTHQEIVVDVKISANRIQVFLFSTAGGPTTQEGTGMRVYDLAPTSDGHENRSLNILFGFMHAAAKERVQILDACFLNPAALKLP